MDFSVRRASVEDARAIAFVQAESWRSTYPGIVPEAYLAALNAESRVAGWADALKSEEMDAFVAEDASGVFGFVCGGKLREAIEGYDAELYAIYLLKGHQRRGAGRRLSCQLAEALREKQFTGMAVWVLEENRPAVAFYKRLGAVQIAQKTIDIGGAGLSDLCLAWSTLDIFGQDVASQPT